MFLQKLLALVVALVALAFSLPAQAADGNIDLTYYCKSSFPYDNTKVVLVGDRPTLDAWRCRVPLTSFSDWPYRDFGVSMVDACRLQFGETSTAQATDSLDPYSWKCSL